MEEKFSLLDLLRQNKIKGLIFDRFRQQTHLRIFPYNSSLGTFEAFISSCISERIQTGNLKKLVLTSRDSEILIYCFLHRLEIGIPDGMGNIDHLTRLNIHELSPGSREDNFIIPFEVLLLLYDNVSIDKIRRSQPKKPLPRPLLKNLIFSRDRCFFDLRRIKGKGSICYLCAKELRLKSYIIPNRLIANIDGE